MVSGLLDMTSCWLAFSVRDVQIQFGRFESLLFRRLLMTSHVEEDMMSLLIKSPNAENKTEIEFQRLRLLEFAIPRNYSLSSPWTRSKVK
jgi:hypothetical protein